MPENVLILKHRGPFAGEFVVTNDDCTYSIGDYIEVVLKDNAYPTDETFTFPSRGGKEKTNHVIAMPMTVTLSACAEPIEVLLKICTGRSFSHWLACLTVGEPSVVIPHKCKWGKYTYWMPKIDGWLPHGLFADKAKAQITTNRWKNNAQH